MQVIKPYGRTHVESCASGPNRRVLAPRGTPLARLDIETFVQSHDRLVIAQWISVIDKIARKPGRKKGATDEQRAFRQRLGDAVWARLVKDGLLPSAAHPGTRERLRAYWNTRIAPYGEALHRARPGAPTPTAKGRWFVRFTGDAPDVALVDVVAVAGLIERHLNSSEFRIVASRPDRTEGQVITRARSIARNVLQPGYPRHKSGPGSGWTDEDSRTYVRAGDVAAAIHRAAEQREAGQDPGGGRRVGADLAAAALYAQFGRLFKSSDGRTLSIAEAKTAAPGLFNLHMAIRDAYSRVLKNHRKDERIHRHARRLVSTLLPQTMGGLLALVDNKTMNRDLNRMVRLGRVIHYEASGDGWDNPQNVADAWPPDITLSRFWTSDGQTEVKRNEAFVRVWRYTLVLASRTLTDWADPHGTIGRDILLQGGMDMATGPAFDPQSQARKLDLLLGNRAVFFKPAQEADQKKILRFALEGIARLRHSAFHFTGLGGFLRAVASAADGADPQIVDAVQQLWREDALERDARLLATAHASHFHYYFAGDRCHTLLDAVRRPASATIALPRFRRVLQRVEDAWSRHGLAFPKSPNRRDLEDPSRLCQFEALKLLYERPFRDWLTSRDSVLLNRFIDRAVERATRASRDLNARDNEDRRESIIARAASLERLAPGDGIERFFFNLTAETASEMRVQRGYENDAERAREQADYIEKLKLDVVALAFAEFLGAMDFGFVLGLKPSAPRAEPPLCQLADLGPIEAVEAPETWQAALYFLIHLVPVEEVSDLLHRLRRWNLLASPSAAATVGPAAKARLALEMYLDMHDAKFTGGAQFGSTEAVRSLYERPEDFDRVFPPDSMSIGGATRTPGRHLREMLRFGGLSLVTERFQGHRIGANEVSRFLEIEARGDDGRSTISRLQDERERLHQLWVRRRRDFSDGDARRYRVALEGVTRHRHLAARVTLTDPVKLHRLLMTVLGRLVDYSGLWERDIYFATLALIYEAGLSPQEAFTPNGIRFLRTGQIVQALRNVHPSTDLTAQLERFFGDLRSMIRIRNDFAHFNMLRSPGAIDLTFWVNQARELMNYDRKLKNAVSRSIRERLNRQNFKLAWTLDASYRLSTATLAARRAFHLGGRTISEDLHGPGFVDLAASLFGQCRTTGSAPENDGPHAAPRSPQRM